MDTTLVILVIIAGLAAAIDTVRVRRRAAEALQRAAAETAALHLALRAVTEHLEALGSVSDAWAILESAPGYMVVRNRDAEITYVTAAAANLMNSTPARLLGSTSVSLKDVQQGTKTLDDFDYLVMLSGKPQSGEINYTAPGTGDHRHMEFHITPLREGGAITGTITVLTSISNYTPRW